jgi:MFS family permease
MTTAVDLAAPTGRFRAHVGGLPRSFWYLWAGTLVNRTGSFITPFLALYLTGARDVSVTQAGVVLSLLGLGSAVSQPVGGVLADRIGRRRTMVLGLTSSAVSLLVLGSARTLPALALTAFAYGMCLDLFRPAVQAAVADLVADRDRARAFALQFWAINLGFSVAIPLGGVLAARGYWLLFVLDAAASLVFAALILRGVPETRPVRTGGSGSLAEVLRDRILLALVACVVGSTAVYMQSFTTLPIAFGLDGLGPASYGAAMAVNGVLIVVLQPLLLGVLGRTARARLLAVAMGLQGVGFALHALADSLPAHLVAIAVWTVGEVLQAGQLGALVAALAPVHLRGRYLGVFGSSFGVAAFLAPALGTQVLDRLGEGVLWGGSLALCLLAGAGLAAVSRAADARQALSASTA